MAIYTKKGDQGETCLVGGKKTSKSSLKIEAIGAVDELNSYLGVVISFSNDSELKLELKQIQKDLFTIGSILGGSSLRFYKTSTNKLEKKIDKLEKKLPKLKHFILPGGTIVGSQLHFVRTLARRVERETVNLNEEESTKGRSSSGRKVRSQILEYLNRLSDYLFMLARNQNFEAKVGEVVWKK